MNTVDGVVDGVVDTETESQDQEIEIELGGLERRAKKRKREEDKQEMENQNRKSLMKMLRTIWLLKKSLIIWSQMRT